MRRKYQISEDFPFIAVLHPIHLLYFRSPPLNSLSYFFDVLDKVDPGKRDDAMDLIYFRIINPEQRKSITGKEKIGELLVGEVSYEVFRRKCQEIVKVVPQDLFVFLLVSHTLKYLFGLGDLTNVDTIVQRHQSDIAYFRNLLKGFESDRPEDRKELNYFVDSVKGGALPFHEDNLREDIEAIIKNLTQSLNGVESRTQCGWRITERGNASKSLDKIRPFANPFSPSLDALAYSRASSAILKQCVLILPRMPSNQPL